VFKPDRCEGGLPQLKKTDNTTTILSLNLFYAVFSKITPLDM